MVQTVFLLVCVTAVKKVCSEDHNLFESIRTSNFLRYGKNHKLLLNRDLRAGMHMEYCLLLEGFYSTIVLENDFILPMYDKII